MQNVSDPHGMNDTHNHEDFECGSVYWVWLG